MLTTTQIRKLAPRPVRYSAGAGAGLELVVQPSGRKSWVYRYVLAGQRESLTLGQWPRISLDAARKRRDLMAEIVARGESAAEHQRRERLRAGDRVTVQEFGARWLAEVVVPARKEPKTVERYLKRDVYPALGARPMSRVTGEEVQRLIFARRDEGSPEAAAAIRHLLKRLFDYGRVCGVSEANPVDRTPLRFVTRHHSRERYLSEAELKIFLQKVLDVRLGRIGTVLELMLLTLCRKSELRCARWEQVDLNVGLWEVPAELSKTGKPHIVYLSQRSNHLFLHLKGLAGNAEVVLPMRDSLTEPMGPATLNKAMNRIKWGMPHFTPHDLRRTASTHLTEMKYNPEWIEKALNHTQPGVRGIYNRYQYGDERKQMLQEWADWLEELRDEA
jgi:integrase